jgi:hypothetical protein
MGGCRWGGVLFLRPKSGGQVDSNEDHNVVVLLRACDLQPVCLVLWVGR